MNIEDTSLSIKIKNILEMLDFFLELHHQGIICCANRISLDLYHNLLGSVSKFESTDCFTHTIGF